MSDPNKRLAVIGGGMGGVATAWFCGGEWDVSLFEAKTKLGGNCDSETLRRHRKDVGVDLGAQFFHPETHPTYIALLELLELHGQPEGAQTEGARTEGRVEMPAHLCVLALDGGDPYFCSTHLMRTPLHALDFAVYSRAAREMAFNGSYDVTVASWIEGLRVSRGFKRQILLPWLTASEGHPFEETRRSSARAILQLFAPSHPKHPLIKATTWSSAGGFQGTVMALAGMCKSTSIHMGSPVLRIEKIDESWFVYSSDSKFGPFDAVVINAPPWESKRLLARLPWAKDLVTVLDRYEYRSHRLVIHTDPAYVHGDRKNWGLANVGIEPKGGNGGHDADEHSELSIWLGAGFEGVDGESTNVFKSWATYRSREPRTILFERTFQHGIKTPGMMSAAHELRSWQGKEGLWFAGQFTTGIDLQESALRSAMEVGESLSPSNANLAALTRRMRARP